MVSKDLFDVLTIVSVITKLHVVGWPFGLISTLPFSLSN